MMEARCDFHVHIGGRNPEDIIDEADGNQTLVIATLDRSQIQFAKQRKLSELGVRRGIRVLPSIESFVEYKTATTRMGLELIGLGLDLYQAHGLEFFNPNGTYRDTHFRKLNHIEAVMADHGLTIEETETNQPYVDKLYREMVLETAINACLAVVTHPINTDPLSKLGIMETIASLKAQYPEEPIERLQGRALYDKLFAFGAPGAFPQPQIEDTIRFIHQAGGAALVAHPNYAHTERQGKAVDILDELFEMGADGLEAYHAGPLDFKLASKARMRGLIIAGGSDSAENHTKRLIGLGEQDAASMFIPLQVFYDIVRYKYEKGLFNA